MKKISEMNANELSVCICHLAEPAERLFSDGAVVEAIDRMRKEIPENATVATVFSLFSTIVAPKLTDEKHRQDTYAVLAAIDGVEAEEIEKRNGLETLRDIFVAFVMERDVETIFRPGCEVRGK